MQLQPNEVFTLYPKDQFDLRKTMLSGQVFNYQEEDGWFIIFNRDEFAAVRQQDNEGGKPLEIYCAEERLAGWSEYFDLATDYEQMVADLGLDRFAQMSYEVSKGIHILRQEPWEMCISYVISQRNNLNNIGNIIRRISKKYGMWDHLASKKFRIPCYRFPEPELLTLASEDSLAETGVGFRNRYIREFTQWAAKSPTRIKAIGMSSTERAREFLMQFNGIGPKVADCILLFGYHRIEQFPIDLWMQRIIDDVYAGELNHQARYGKFAGVIQQYMFNFVRNHEGLKIWEECQNE